MAILPHGPEYGRHIAGIEDADIEVIEAEPGEGVAENEDGSADIIVGGADAVSIGHEDNLVTHLDASELDRIASDLLEKLDRDKEARSKRDEQYEEGIRRTGLGNDAPGGATFTGASKVVHPMLAEGCVDFAASAMKELYPPDGPARTKIEGETSQAKVEVANRQKRYLNWQLSEQMSEYPEELEQLLTQLPMGGSQYQKFWFSASHNRIVTEFVPIDDVYLPYACTDFYSAQRITHVQRLTQMVYDERVAEGVYVSDDAHPSSVTPEVTKAEAANEKVEGKSGGFDNTDGERLVFEVSTFCKLSIDGDRMLPYLVSIDNETRKVVAVYRNWEERDESRKRLEWMVEYGFIPWRGAYKIGLPHLIGGLSAAATGALRALLDSAHFNNMPGFLRLKGARLGGETKQVNPAEGVEIGAAGTVDDIRKLTMPLPYNPPSPVLFQLLGWLDQAAKGVVTTAEEKIRDASNQMPVGTTLALIEQGAKVFSSIHARLHRSQRRAFRIIARLNAKHLSTARQMADLGEVLATKEDFAHPLSVIPVSDPNIFSEAQRYAQAQMVLQLATGQATAPLHNLYAVLKRTYEIAKIPNINEFLIEPKKPHELNAAAENASSMMGAPIIAFPEQDHFAHIETHMRFLTDPFLGGSPMAMQQSMPALMEHVKQHLAFLYAKVVHDLCEQALGGDVGGMFKNKAARPQMDRLIASASKQAHLRIVEMFAPLGDVINQMVQMIAEMRPPPPMDPSQVALQVSKGQEAVEMAKVEERRAAGDKKVELDAAKLQQKAEADAEKARLAEQKLAQDAAADGARIALDNQEMHLGHGVEVAKLASQEHHQELQLEEMRDPGNQIPGA